LEIERKALRSDLIFVRLDGVGNQASEIRTHELISLAPGLHAGEVQDSIDELCQPTALAMDHAIVFLQLRLFCHASKLKRFGKHPNQR